MKKPMLIALFLLCFVTAFSSHKKSNEWQQMSYNLEKSGVKIEKIEVEGHSFFHCNENLIAIVNQIYEDSGFSYPCKLQVKKDEVILKSSYTTLTVKYMTKENLNYASFIVSQYMQVKNINNIRGSITKGLGNYTRSPTFSYLLKGKYYQKLTTQVMKNISNKVLLQCGSKNNNGIVERNLVSYVGFTPLIKEKISVLDKVVNLNVALRYDKSEGNTYIWIGCPIIAIEY